MGTNILALVIKLATTNSVPKRLKMAAANTQLLTVPVTACWKKLLLLAWLFTLNKGMEQYQNIYEHLYFKKQRINGDSNHYIHISGF